MNNLIRQRIEHLAAEYVLGTLQGKARKRFFQLLLENPQLLPVVWRWEECFVNLSDASVRSTPPKSLKANLLKRLDINVK